MPTRFDILFLLFFCLLCRLEPGQSAKELSPLQKMGRLGRNLFGSLGSARHGVAEVRLSRGKNSANRNHRPKRIRFDAIQMPSQHHLTAEDPLFGALTAHRQSKPLILPIDLSQLSISFAPPHLTSTQVQLPDLDPHFVRGSADDYLLDRGFDLPKNAHSSALSTSAHSRHQIEAHLLPDFTDSALLPLLELDRQFTKPFVVHHNQNPQSSSLTPAMLEQHAAAQFISASAQPSLSHLSSPFHLQMKSHSSSSPYGAANTAQLIRQMAQQGDALSDYIFDLSGARTAAAVAGESSRKQNPSAMPVELTPLELTSYGIKNEYTGDEATPMTKFNLQNDFNDDEVKFDPQQIPSSNERWTSLENHHHHRRKASKEAAANRALWQYIRKSAALKGRLDQLLAEESWPTTGETESNLSFISRSSPSSGDRSMNKSSTNRKRDWQSKTEFKIQPRQADLETEVEEKMKNSL